MGGLSTLPVLNDGNGNSIEDITKDGIDHNGDPMPAEKQISCDGRRYVPLRDEVYDRLLPLMQERQRELSAAGKKQEAEGNNEFVSPPPQSEASRQAVEMMHDLCSIGPISNHPAESPEHGLPAADRMQAKADNGRTV